MDRPKTDSELQQEQADEEFARQLQEQLNQPSHPTNTSLPTQAPAESSQEVADAAMARQLQEQINRQEAAAEAGHHLKRNSEEQLEVECPVCTFINHIKPSSAAKHWRCSQCREPLPNPSVPVNRSSQKDLVECKVCHSLNRLPVTKSDTVLCGGCYQELGSSLKAVAPQESEENQRTVQLRCGQCNVINAVTVGADVKKMEFICGGCGVLNTIVLD
jgi:transposase-like protein